MAPADSLENTANRPAVVGNTPPLSPTCRDGTVVKLKGKRRNNIRRPRPQLLTRAELDGRTNAAKYFDNLVASIKADIGGHDTLSAIQLTLIEGYVAAAVTMQNLNARVALGEEIDSAQLSHSVNAMIKIAGKLGIKRQGPEEDEDDISTQFVKAWKLDQIKQREQRREKAEDLQRAQAAEKSRADQERQETEKAAEKAASETFNPGPREILTA
jgi:hypothetical protein